MNYPEPYKRKESKYYQFIFVDPVTGTRKRKSTGAQTKREAKEFIHDFISDLKENRGGPITFRDYAAPFFIWETCPRVQRRLDDGLQIGKYHVQKSRRWLDEYVLNTKFADLPMHEIRRSHLLDLRQELKKTVPGINTLNKVMDTVKTIFSEAYFRQDIDFNPGHKIGKLKYDQIEKGTFSPEEIQLLFADPNKYFYNDLAYAAFYLAAFTGMRTGEVLALKWDKVDWFKKEGSFQLSQPGPFL